MSTIQKLSLLCGLLLGLCCSPASAQPANDDCVAATAIGEGTFPLDTSGSSLDGPTDADANMGADVWFLYTATTGGLATIETCGTSGTLSDSVIIVYDASNGCPGAGDPGIASDDDGCSTPTFSSTLSLPICAGDSLYIQVGGWNGATGTSDLTVSVAGGPTNDDCASAAAVAEGTHPVSTCGATLDGPIDADSNMGADVWYLYTASADGLATIETCGTTGSLDDSVLIVYDAAAGCPAAGDLGLASDDDGCTSPPFSSTVTIPVTGGSSYLVQVGGWNGLEGSSDLVISLASSVPEDCFDGVDNDADGATDCADSDCSAEAVCQEAGNCADGIDNDADGATDCDDVMDCGTEPSCQPPANDDCLAAIAIGEGATPFDNTNATLDGPTAGDGNMSADVWFLYTATVGGTATIGTCLGGGSLDDTVLIVYDAAAGCPVAGDSGLASSDDDCSNVAGGSAFMSSVELPVCAGDSLLIQVGGWNGATGAGALDIAIAAPAGDDCASALAVGEGQHSWSNCGATLDGPTDGDSNMGADIWFLYTASGDGTAEIGTCFGGGSLDDTVLIVYDAGTGCPVAGDLGIAASDDACENVAGGSAFMSSVTIPVTSGSSFYVQVGGWNGAEGDGLLSISLPETCDDGIDNDADGLVDCVDDDCLTDTFCLEAGNCGDGLDNDGDGLTDCADDDCLAEVLCDGLPPANDNCVDALVVVEGTSLWENLDATLDGPTDGDGNMGTDVWFVYTPTCDGTATISTCDGLGTLDDTVLIVYDGSVGCPVAGDLGLAASDDACSLGGGAAFNSEVSIAVTAGNPYLIQAGGWNGATGSAPLNITFSAEGDACIDAVAVGEGAFPFDTCGATLDGPTAGDANMGADVWFLYTPTLSGDATIGTCLGSGSNDDTVIIVYDGATGCPVGGDAGLASSDDACENAPGGAAFMSEVTVPVTLGSTYYVQVGGWNGLEGDGILTIDTVLPCVDPIPSFSAGPLLTGIAPLTVDFMNLSDDGGDPATTYAWSFGDGASSAEASPSHTFADAGTFDVTLTASGCGASVATTLPRLVTTYAMGDANGDASVDVADAISIANWLFAGGPAPICGNAGDINGDGAINIADPIWMLGWLFSGGAAPVPPAGPGC